MAPYFIRDYPCGSSVGCLVVISYGNGKCVVGPRTIYISSPKTYCWLYCGGFVSYMRSDYPSMSHSNKDRLFSSLSLSGYDIFITSGDGRGGVDPKKTHFSPI